MNILAIDIGAGTQDILIFDSDLTRDFESAYKLVLPSPTRIMANELRRTREDVVIFGDTMGGGAFTRAVLDHLRDYKVYMTEDAARTLRDDLERVRDYGIELITSEQELEELSETAAPIKIADFNLQLMPTLASFGIDTNFDVIAIAVQDHGVAPAGLTDREHRFQLREEKVGERLESFAYLDDVPENLSRMRSLYRSLSRWYDGHILLMDTGPAAVLGSLEDERVNEKDRVVCVNVGNAHTIAISLNEGQIEGIFEHHTHLLDKPKLETYLTRLCDGTITFQEVFNDGGHGAVVRGANQPEIISVTGPNRGRMAGLGVFAAPAGDMMMSGAVGLIKAVLNRL